MVGETQEERDMENQEDQGTGEGCEFTDRGRDEEIGEG